MSNTPQPQKPPMLSSSPRTSTPPTQRYPLSLPGTPQIDRMSSPIPRESSPASPGGTGVAPIPDQKLDADLPMTMTASVILTSLPGDAKKALEKASQAGDGGAPVKVTIHFHPLRDAPPLKPTRFKITATQPFSAVVSFLRKRLRLKDSDSVWCYVGNFSPSPDEGVGGLYSCFRTADELKVGYSITPTFG